MEDIKVLVDEGPLEELEDEAELVEDAEVAIVDEAGSVEEVEKLLVLLVGEVIMLFMEKVIELRNTPL